MDDENKIEHDKKQEESRMADFFNFMHESFVNEYCGINAQKSEQHENLQYDDLYYKMNGIETEMKEIKQKLVVPKGENCDGCLHCTTRLKQCVNMFGDPTRIDEEFYCDFFNQTLYENGKEFCCKKSVSKCFQCKLNFTSEEKKNSDMAQMLLLYLLFASEELKDKIANKMEEDRGKQNADN